MGEAGMTQWTKTGHDLILSHKLCMLEVAGHIGI